MGRHYRYDVVEKPGVGEFLAALQADGRAPVRGHRRAAGAVSVALERLGLRPYFEFVTDSYEVGLRKSDPAYFPAVARRLGAARRKTCWVFEDALHAMESAKAAGMRVCAIDDYTGEPQREAILSVADAFISDYRRPPRMLRPAGGAFGKLTAAKQHMP